MTHAVVILADPAFADYATVRELLASRPPFCPVITDHPFITNVARRMGNPVTTSYVSMRTKPDVITLGVPMARKKPVPAAKAVRKITPGEQRALDKARAVRRGETPTPLTDAIAVKRIIEAQADKPATKQPPQPPVGLDAVPDIADVLPAYATEYLQLLADERRIEARKDELSSDIQALLGAVDQRSVLTPEWQVSRARGASVSISKEMLLELGVKLAVIAAATVRKPYTYVVVSDPRVPRSSGKRDYRGGNGGDDE